MNSQVIDVGFRVLDDDGDTTTDLVESRLRQKKSRNPGKPLEGTSFDDILSESIPYDEGVSPYTDNERVGFYLGCVGIAVGLLLVLFADHANEFSQGLPDNLLFPGLQHLYLWAVSSFSWLRPFMIAGNLIAGSLAMALWQYTGLQEGIQGWHRIGVGLSIWGLVQVIVAMLPLVVIAFNLVAWVAIAIFVVIVGFFVLVILFGAGIASLSVR